MLPYTNTTSFFCLVICLLAIALRNALISGQYPTSANGPPRFKQNARTHQYAYLGDGVRFQCSAVGRPQPKVHWYRNGGYLNYSFMQNHSRFIEGSMSLEIQNIKVSDKGNWMCRVWNSEGSTTRNFTLHIFNYCNYFLNEKIAVDDIPEECACKWARQTGVYVVDDGANNIHENSVDSMKENAKIRSELKLSEFDAERCARIERDNVYNSIEQQNIRNIKMTTKITTLAPLKQITVHWSQKNNEKTTTNNSLVTPQSTSISAKQTEIHITKSHKKKNNKMTSDRPLNRIRIILEHPKELLISSKSEQSMSAKSEAKMLENIKQDSITPKYIQRMFATKTTIKNLANGEDEKLMTTDKWSVPSSPTAVAVALQSPTPVNSQTNNRNLMQKPLTAMVPNTVSNTTIIAITTKFPAPISDTHIANVAVLNNDVSKKKLAARIVANISSVSTTRQDNADRIDNSKAVDKDEENEKNEQFDNTSVNPNRENPKVEQLENHIASRVRPISNRTDWPDPPSKVAPYFRTMDSDVNENVVLPAGRTLKLTCKAGGQPEPQIIWRKDNTEIQRDTESRTGSLFHLRKWSLELEDTAESDSGDYECEVFNSVGWIVRRFRVDVQDRLRSRPIIVPNVLLNHTVDVNSTVRFTCQVISDLVPHIVWIKLIRRNGSYIRIDTARNQQSFNFIDMSTIQKAHLYHDSRTNKYTLEIVNVTMEDQGIYSCVAGNTLGMSMANATLIVNEFRPMTLPTENPYQWPFIYTMLLAIGAVVLMAFLALSILYCSFSDSAKHNRVQSLDKIAVRKKVIITKKAERSGDVWSDLASSYAITVEPVLSSGSGLALDSGVMVNGGGSGGCLTDALIVSHPTAQSDVTFLSEYEVPTDAAWEIDRNRLQLVDILGEGAFGEVWKGVLRVLTSNTDENNDVLESRVPVAVKKLKPTANEKELIILVSEMQILKSIGEHRNILRLVGCCTGVGPLLVVLEVCPHGNLRDFLRKHRPREDDLTYNDEEDGGADFENSVDFSGADGTGANAATAGRSHEARRVVMYQNVENLNEAIIKNLTLRDLVRFSTEVARGMEFLASKKIIHRDLAARNVLVAENYTMKISDFGLSRNVFYQDYYRKRGAGRLPIKWMAPEALEANVYTVYSDVWSYGILLWEIMTLGGTPYPSIAMPQLYNILKEGYRMEAPHNCPDEVYGIMVMCWQDKPEQRPQFQTIADYFDWMLTEATNYAMKGDDGETTDEGPYAVINETLNHSAGRTNAARIAGTRLRPLSAPGIMSFEAFAQREAAKNHKYLNHAMTQARATHKISVSHSCEDSFTTTADNSIAHNSGDVNDENVPLLSVGSLARPSALSRNSSSHGLSNGPARKKSSLIELIQSERAHHAVASSLSSLSASRTRVISTNESPDSHLYTNTLEMLGKNSKAV